uniref:hypothetical protein n=1 Tax=Flavobacterium sp. TaxID=239 RepID=UPI00404B4758
MQYRLESACLIKAIYKSNELNENSFATTLLLKDYNWCNIDRFIQSESSINFEVKTKNLYLNRRNTYLVND